MSKNLRSIENLNSKKTDAATNVIQKSLILILILILHILIFYILI